MWQVMVVLATLSLWLLTGCAHKDKDEEEASSEEIAQVPLEEIYNEALDLLKAKKYKSSVEKFEQVEREYPYSPWAIKAKLMTAYGYYRQDKYEDAILALEGFIKLHPGNKYTAYAYYLKALCYYEQIADVRRDQQLTEKAQGALTEMIQRFPLTDYARDAQIKLDLVQDHLAGKEMEIARFYLKKGNMVAAINRFKKVITKYETTNHAAEALYRLSEAYLALGVEEEAKRYAAVLGHNFPASFWYKQSYALLKENPPPHLVTLEKDNKKASFWKKITSKVGMPE